MSTNGMELVWPGKYDASGQRAKVPRIHPRLDVEECHGSNARRPAGNELVVGDNVLAMDAWLDRHAGAVDLVYVDPPFATGGTFEFTRTRVGKTLRLPAYRDRWEGGVAGLVQMLDPRLRMIHELLAAHGSLYVHLDPGAVHAVKLLLDEIFGEACFQREIVWRIGWVSGFKTRARNWIRNHDSILFYVKDPRHFTFNKLHVPHLPQYRRRDGSLPSNAGIAIDDVWNANPAEFALQGAESLDSIQIKSFSREKTGYATQKNEALLRRIVEASSNPGDLVMDVFCGSGTTPVVAQRLGRRWLACDVSRLAIGVTRSRLMDLASDFRVCATVSVERQQACEDIGVATIRRVVLDAHRATELSHDVLHGRKRGAFVLVVVERACELADIERAARACAALGGRTLHIVAFAYSSDDVPSRSSGVRVHRLLADRELLHARPPRHELAIVPLPEVSFTLARTSVGAVKVTLEAATHVRALLPEALRSQADALHDPLEAWGVAWQTEPGQPWRPRAWARRDDSGAVERTLELPPAADASTSRVVVRVFDILGCVSAYALESPPECVPRRARVAKESSRGGSPAAT